MDNTITNEEVTNALVLLKDKGVAKPNKTLLIAALARLEVERQIKARQDAANEEARLKEEAEFIAFRYIRQLLKSKSTDEEILDKLSLNGWTYSHSFDVTFHIQEGDCPELDEARKKYREFCIPSVGREADIKRELKAMFSDENTGVDALLSNSTAKAMLEKLRKQIFDNDKLIEAVE